MLITFHPYALELFSRASPAAAPAAFFCQRNYVMAFQSLAGPEVRTLSLLDLFSELLFESLEENSRRPQIIWFRKEKKPLI